MNDDLIARLRSDDPDVWPEAEEAADALEAKDRRIAELEKEAENFRGHRVSLEQDFNAFIEIRFRDAARIAALGAAIDLFIAYDETDDEDMVAMVQCYDAAIEAARKVRGK